MVAIDTHLPRWLNLPAEKVTSGLLCGLRITYDVLTGDRPSESDGRSRRVSLAGPRLMRTGAVCFLALSEILCTTISRSFRLHPPSRPLNV